MEMNGGITRETLEAEHCWLSIDAVPGEEAVTAFKRHARLHQALWRKKNGFPGGGQLQEGGERIPVGSRLDLNFAKETGANFLSPRIVAAVQHRLAHPEKHQALIKERLWSDLLSSMPMCFNLFGELWDDPLGASRALKAWFPDAPGSVDEVLFEWSPGRLDSSFLGNRSAFDTAFLLQLKSGRGILAFETKYHEHAKVETAPEPARLRRYREITEQSKIFQPDWEERILSTDLQQLWLDHLLALSMAQHQSGSWNWVRFVLVYPSRNPSFASAADRYRNVLSDSSTFQTRTLEQLLETSSALPSELIERFRERYLW